MKLNTYKAPKQDDMFAALIEAGLRSENADEECKSCGDKQNKVFAANESPPCSCSDVSYLQPPIRYNANGDPIPPDGYYLTIFHDNPPKELEPFRFNGLPWITFA